MEPMRKNAIQKDVSTECIDESFYLGDILEEVRQPE
jgi:hypothetical protein